ncbi:MAG: LysM peptidoglycan-binding domain-containing protein [Streptosporangiaceae bacterium]
MHLAAMLTAVEHRAAAAKPPVHVTVHAGETLSGLASRYHIKWPGLYEANRKAIGANPNVLRIGQHLRVPSAAAAVRLASRYHPAPVAAVAAPVQATADVQQPQAPATPAAVTAAPVQATATATVSSGAPGSFQQCVINAESGGNPQVMNSTGHYGLYQFSYSTWVANGGNPADFGGASAAEQNQVFQTAYAASGSSPWAPYDGC